MGMLDRLIAITDVETTGLYPNEHEIVEIGLVVVDPKSLKIVNKFDAKVLPEHPETASERALEINGYNAKDWQGAMPLKEAMKIFSAFTKDAKFSAWNITFDWSFIEKAFADTNVPNGMDYHRIDLTTMAGTVLLNNGPEKIRMNDVARYLDIPEEPIPHRAINGALTEYEIFKKLVAKVRRLR